MQVFISYAHTTADTTLAKFLAASLKSVGVDAWLDEARLRAGAELQSQIQKGIAESDHGVFLLSQSWLERKWTAFELAQFARRDTSVVRLIPIYRASRTKLVLPPDFVKVLGFHWLEDETNDEARLWELYCAITSAAPGPAEDWPTRWKEIARTGPPVDLKPVSRPPVPPAARIRPSLYCDRAVQWSAVNDLSLEPSNRLILVPGSVGQDHDHFIQRVQHLLRQDPPRTMVTVDWPTRPRSEGEFLENLAGALRVDAPSLAAELGRRLTHDNLVFLHPCVRARYVDDDLVAYYATYLPGVLAEAKGTMSVKCVQPIEWPLEPVGVKRLLTLFRATDGPSAEEGRTKAEELIRRLASSQAESLPVFRLRDLAPIVPPDLVEFCGVMKLRQKQSDWLLERIEERGAQTPKDIFQAIDDFLPDARSIQ